MAATHGRKARRPSPPLGVELAEIAGENVLARFRGARHDVGPDLEMLEERIEGRGPGPLSRFTIPLWSRTLWRPVDLEETGTAYRARVDLPGVHREEVTIRFLDQDLEVQVDARKSIEGKRRNFVFQERIETSSRRRIPFPTSVVPEKADARLEDGVLTVTVPKRTPSPPHRIEIE